MPLTDIKVKVYTALLSQEGTNAPIATMLQNTYKEPTLTLSRVNTGYYRATSSTPIFTENKTICITSLGNDQDSIISAFRESDTVIGITTLFEGLASDDVMDIGTCIEIRTYNN